MAGIQARTFVPHGWWRWYPWGYGGLQCLIALSIMASSLGRESLPRVVGLAAAVGGALFGAYLVLFTPRALTVDDTGVRMAAPVRTTEIPWGALASVETRGSGLVWHRRRGRRVVTSCTWSDHQELLEVIGRHVPVRRGRQTAP